MSYIGITEEQSNPFSPVTAELVKQLRDNPIAMAAGASGAPRVRGTSRRHNLLADVTAQEEFTEFAVTGLPPHTDIIIKCTNFRKTIHVSELQVSGNNGGSWVTLIGMANFPENVEMACIRRVFSGHAGSMSFSFGTAFDIAASRGQTSLGFSLSTPINAVRVVRVAGSGQFFSGARFQIWGLAEGYI